MSEKGHSWILFFLFLKKKTSKGGGNILFIGDPHENKEDSDVGASWGIILS